MKKFTQRLEFYIDQYDIEKQIFKLGEEISKRGWLNKNEFLTICLWKSRRPKILYNLNSETQIIQITKLVFTESDELKKIRLLTNLKGVRIPTASAILSVSNPKIYPIMDERCLQSLQKLGVINWKTITENNWIKYLELIRELANKNKRTAREIEKGLFAFNRINLDNEYINLYNQNKFKMNVIAVSHQMNGDLDDDYTLYDNGEVLHEYDRNRYPGGYNLKETLTADQLKYDVKQRLLNAASEENKELVRQILRL